MSAVAIVYLAGWLLAIVPIAVAIVAFDRSQHKYLKDEYSMPAVFGVLFGPAWPVLLLAALAGFFGRFVVRRAVSIADDRGWINER